MHWFAIFFGNGWLDLGEPPMSKTPIVKTPVEKPLVKSNEKRLQRYLPSPHGPNEIVLPSLDENYYSIW